MADKNSTPIELLRELRGRGITNTEIAGELGRDPRMIRKVLNGETSGNAYRGALYELATTGRVTSQPARRRGRDGTLVKVRAGRDAKTKTVTPEDRSGRYTNERQGGRFRSTTYLGGGGRQHELHVPKGNTAKGRQDATKHLIDTIRSASRGQAHDTQKRIRATLTFANGRVMEVKDYNASTLLDRVNHASNGDALTWLTEQTAERYANLDTSKTPITGITLTVYETPKSDQYRRNAASRRGRN